MISIFKIDYLYTIHYHLFRINITGQIEDTKVYSSGVSIIFLNIEL